MDVAYSVLAGCVYKFERKGSRKSLFLLGERLLDKVVMSGFICAAHVMIPRSVFRYGSTFQAR